MTFLGFTIYRMKNRSGTDAKTVFETESKRLSRAKSAIREKLKRNRHKPIEKQAEAINATLRGHFNYYGLAGNRKKIAGYWHFVREEWRHCLSRRSQNGRVTWADFLEIEEKFPLVSPKLRISYAQLASFVRL
ncbi:MAG: hypothetical protein A2428_10095 [Bdellovibrionales bacterium RIFOXYC1_FULL_54_43]|nr:MAG: hypothetical protein A2428_10095 [Bdellovibrionales bacterium RIFOXYC1_FULL_54_43]OFZ80534.1 MAG: hypothetical protein A2603_13190 [Bdellovibrionales bacterium RIFOXYD1_FULL_55_31]